MTLECRPSAHQDPQALRLYEWAEKEGEINSICTRKLTRLDYSGKTPRRIELDRHNPLTQGPRIYDYFLNRAESEQLEQAKRFTKLNSPLSTPPFKFQSKTLKLLQDLGNTKIPWIFDDLDEATDEDRKLFEICVEKIESSKKEFEWIQKEHGIEAYQRVVAWKIYEFIYTPQSQHGLGIKFSQTPTQEGYKNLREIYLSGEANCVEFVYLFFALSHLAELPVAPIEIFHNSQKAQAHLVAGLFADSQKLKPLLFFDLQGVFTGVPKTDDWSEFSLLDLEAAYYNALAYREHEKGSNEAIKLTLLKHALLYAPYEYMALTNYAALLISSGSAPQALPLLERSKKVYPHYPDLKEQLKFIQK